MEAHISASGFHNKVSFWIRENKEADKADPKHCCGYAIGAKFIGKPSTKGAKHPARH